MNWHKVSEELPPEDKPILFRRSCLTCLNDYMYFVGRFNEKWGDIYAYTGQNETINQWPEWTLIEPPQDSNND